MAIRIVPLEPLLDYYSAPKKLHGIGFTKAKDRREIWSCYDVLTIWADKFAHLGKLVSLEHLSNPDDPPDVRAIFDSGVVLDMEHTSTEAAHRHKAEKLRGGRGGVVPPVSGVYKTTKELMDAMNPYSGGGWVSVEKEAIARYELIFAAMKKKIQKHPPGGVLVLEGDGFTSDFTLPHSVGAAYANIRSVPGAEKWTYCYITRANGIDYYSTIFSPTIPFDQRRPPPPDPTKIKRFFKNKDSSDCDSPGPPRSLQG